MVNLAQAWSESFMGSNPDVQITVKGGGSGAGITALINGTTDFADASREIKPEEVDQAKANNVQPVPTEVAKDGIAVIVNKANPVTDLSSDQLGQIYSGKVTNWNQVGGSNAPIVLLGRDTSSGTYEFFQTAILGTEKYAKSMRSLQSNQAIVDEVTKNPNAVGYVGLGYENASLKVVKVDGEAASVDTVKSGSYVLSRSLYMIGNGEATGAKKAYLDWILGPDGQKVVKDQGFVPLSQ